VKEVYKYDADGIYIEPVILKDNETTPVNCTEMKPTGSFYKGKFANGQWTETLTQTEIDKLVNEPQPLTEMDQIKKNQELMQQALDDLIFGGAL
jgi:hypothetical protein